MGFAQGSSDASVRKFLIDCATKVGHIDLDPTLWAQASQEAQDLVCKLLTFIEPERATAAKALEHVWIARHSLIDSSLTVLTGHLKTIEEYRSHNQLKKRAMLS